VALLPRNTSAVLKNLKIKNIEGEKRIKKIYIEAETERKINRNTPKNHKTSR
jgi:hypothetical protein